MMSRRIAVLMIALSLCISTLSAASFERDKEDIKPAQILLLYDEDLSDEDYENVASIADILTYMGYSVSYSSIASALGQLKHFENIILYNNHKLLEREFLVELQGIEARIFSIGNGVSLDLIKALHLNRESEMINDRSVGFKYEFTAGKARSRLMGKISMALLVGEFNYTNGEILLDNRTFDYCVRQGRFSNIALYDANNNILKAAFIQEIAMWMWPYNGLPHRYTQYIVFDKVYPFFDGNHMVEIIDLFYEMGVPYVIAVMPVYENIEYPAMKRFCEVLRYAQSKGGTIIMNAPIIQGRAAMSKEITEKINLAYRGYSQYGVYPMALQAPLDWIYDVETKKVLRYFKTIFLTNPKESGFKTDLQNNEIYADGHQFIPQIFSDSESDMGLVSFCPSAIYLNMMSEKEELRQKAESIKQSDMLLKSLGAVAHTINTDEIKVNYQKGLLEVQGELVSLEYVPFKYDEEFEYNRGTIGRFMEVMAKSNRRLLIGVSIICILFILLIILGRVQNRKKFFY